jgi:hypothetical protein
MAVVFPGLVQLLHHVRGHDQFSRELKAAVGCSQNLT